MIQIGTLEAVFLGIVFILAAIIFGSFWAGIAERRSASALGRTIAELDKWSGVRDELLSLLRSAQSGELARKMAASIIQGQTSEYNRARRAGVAVVEGRHKERELRQYLSDNEEWDDDVFIDVSQRIVRRGDVYVSWAGDDHMRDKARKVYVARLDKGRVVGVEDEP